MGYTHYWYRSAKEQKHNKAKWTKFVKDCKIIADKLPIDIELACAEPEENRLLYINGCFHHRDAQFNNEHVHFNGGGKPSEERRRKKQDGRFYWEDDAFSHETFSIEREVEPKKEMGIDNKNTTFGFCKTARKPYDVMVTACLILYKYHFEKLVQISSDGDPEEWDTGWRLIAEYHPKGKQIVSEMKIYDNLFEECLPN